MDRATDSLLLRGTQMPPTGYHSEGSAPSGVSRTSTMYSGSPCVFMSSMAEAAASRFTAPSDLVFGAAFFLGGGACLPKPLAMRETPMAGRRAVVAWSAGLPGLKASALAAHSTRARDMAVYE